MQGHWLHNAKVKLVDLQLGHGSKTVSSIVCISELLKDSNNLVFVDYTLNCCSEQMYKNCQVSLEN